jgi:hypothetical protein
MKGQKMGVVRDPKMGIVRDIAREQRTVQH